MTRLAEEGYCLVEDVLDRDEAERLDRLAHPVLDPREVFDACPERLRALLAASAEP